MGKKRRYPWHTRSLADSIKPRAPHKDPRVVHYLRPGHSQTACWRDSAEVTSHASDPSWVTCKRCLRALIGQ